MDDGTGPSGATGGSRSDSEARVSPPAARTPDEVCAEYARRGTKLTVRELGDGDELILIEGESNALEFLGHLLLAQASFGDCGFQIAPRGAGKGLFSKESTKGIYIHRLPCTEADG